MAMIEPVWAEPTWKVLSELVQTTILDAISVEYFKYTLSDQKVDPLIMVDECGLEKNGYRI
jgi:hypothetical protein